MSHVDEGALHAYLDGALEEYPSGEARRIRAHLERCERCAEALAEARRVRDEADLLLALPGVDVSAPPLEELRLRAQSASEGAGGAEASRRRVPLYRLGWAASVVLALGVGWMLRGGAPESAGPAAGPGLAGAGAADASESFQAESSVAEAPSPAPLEQPASPSPSGRGEARLADAVPAAPAPTVVPEADVTAVEVADAGAPATARDVVEEMAVAYEDRAVAADATEEVVMEGAGVDAVAEMSAQAGSSDTARLELERVVPTSAARLSLAARSASEPSALQGGGVSADDADLARQRDEEAAEAGSLVVPGLEVLSIAWREEGVVPAGVRVRQRLESGEVLELIHLPAGFDPDSVAPAEEGVGELVVARDQGWLIMRAPLSEADMRTLLQRMDQPPPE